MRAWGGMCVCVSLHIYVSIEAEGGQRVMVDMYY